ncbi:LysR substrate-binding domain-containing protein [Paraburkholderia diazotrophica]|uniref:DNA-binding transcriptional regulator, LysR family n=1 Tax=Paraburkholderia diazotrophica TaxID=667676 RepID=A0A1H6VIZ6_9BURK|nr:LysR substrate-binding domain-containing protein [Paraburkholderia diazotrophica]SEJ02924.1 DNA-binding transcriptional regulator, LysR family [Paraburkholderia diazotrophica]
MDSLSGLVAFIRAAEARSFVTAARTLGVSASAVGKSVARLEENLGVRLFYRSTRQINLTEEGSVFFERCRYALQEIQDAEAQLSKATIAPRGRLRVSMPAIGYRVVMPIIPQFRSLYPEVELDLDFNDRLVDVIDEGFDVVIRGGELADSRLKSRHLGPYRFVVCASPEYFARHGVPLHAEDLANHVCLRFKYQSSGKLQDWLIDGVLPVQGAGAAIPLVLNNAEAVLSAAIQGLGIAYVPDFVARDALMEGRLRMALESSTTVEGVFHALWPTNRHMLPKLRVFVDYLAEHLDAMSGSVHVPYIPRR